jgi:hypothetical protein
MKLFPALLMLAVSVGCGGDGATPPATVDPAIGQYVLQTVGGKPLPAVVSQTSAQTTTVTSGTLALNAGGTMTLSFDETQTLTASGQVTPRTDQAEGTWIRSASGLSFRNVTVNGGPTETVNVAESATGITLSGPLFTESGGDFFYRKSN